MAIDLVITWVDGTHGPWRKQFRAESERAGVWFQESDFNHRFLPYLDLEILLRSVQAYAGTLFRKIWIVHDPVQQPKVRSDLIELVPHDRIIPKDFLPTFNSLVIESYLHRIPGLAEKFVYMNDDTYFAAPVKRSNFFLGEKPLVHLAGPVPPLDKPCERSPGWKLGLSRANYFLTRTFYPDEEPEAVLRAFPTHTARALTKSIINESWKLFEEILIEQSKHKFRESSINANRNVSTAGMLFPWAGIELGLALPAPFPEDVLKHRWGQLKDACEDPRLAHFPIPSRFELPPIPQSRLQDEALKLLCCV